MEGRLPLVDARTEHRSGWRAVTLCRAGVAEGRHEHRPGTRIDRRYRSRRDAGRLETPRRRRLEQRPEGASRRIRDAEVRRRARLRGALPRQRRRPDVQARRRRPNGSCAAPPEPCPQPRRRTERHRPAAGVLGRSAGSGRWVRAAAWAVHRHDADHGDLGRRNRDAFEQRHCLQPLPRHDTPALGRHRHVARVAHLCPDGRRAAGRLLLRSL